MESSIVYHLVGREAINFKQLQGHAVIVSIQRAHPACLQALYLTTVNVNGPVLEVEANELEDQ